ncbi:hypothetical protein CTI12_AA491190 [Artemisia annua]|uniref:Uncharacterized protein n=1 Tax=Artemisia annua TaxID=35608 RepID=A0A2U1LBT7_ARTAN|nr:hypothetical protein CTI12_AA491190 [Artemisia annua]
MAAIPNIEQLKEACGFERLQDCFKFLFVQQRAELEVFIQQIGQKCDELRTTAENLQHLTQETETFGPFDEVAGDVLESLNEMADRDRRILDGLVGVLDIAREGRAEKDHHIFVMDLHGKVVCVML